jgi:hypothetical protein
MNKKEHYIFVSALSISLVVAVIVLCAYYMGQEPITIPDLRPVASGRFGKVDDTPRQLAATSLTNTDILVGLFVTVTVLVIPVMLVWGHIKDLSIKDKLRWLVGDYLTEEEIKARKEQAEAYRRYLNDLYNRASTGDLIAHDEWKSIHQKPQTTWFFFFWW